MEERFRHITHKRQSIVLLDLSNLQDEMEIPRLLKLRSTLHMPHGLFADLTGTHFSREIMKAAKENAKAIRPANQGVRRDWHREAWFRCW